MTLFARVFGLVALGTLAFSGLSHIAHFQHLRRAIEAHGVLARRRKGPQSLIAAGLVATEVALPAVGFLAISGLGSESERTRAVTFLLVAGVYLVLATYALALFSLRSGAPCGCASSSEPVNEWTVMRAALLAALSLACVPLASLVTLRGPESQVSVAVLAALALGTVLWVLPAVLGTEVVAEDHSSDGSSAYVELVLPQGAAR